MFTVCLPEFLTEACNLTPHVAAFLTAIALGLASSSSKGKHNVTNRSNSISTIASMINRSLPLDTILKNAIDVIVHSLEMDAGIIELNSANGSSPRIYVTGFDDSFSDLPETIGDQPQPLPFLSTEAAEWGTGALAEALRSEKMKLYAAYPITSGDKILGSLKIASKSASSLSFAQEENISALCEIVGTAIVHAQLRDQSNKLSEDLVALQEVNKIISQSFDLEDIIRRIVVEGKRLVKTSQCHLFLLDNSEENLVGSASTQSEDFDIQQIKIKIFEASSLISALLEKHAIALEDFSGEERIERT
ncbi:MAG: hypothetical protein P8Z37_11490 [Acidobacteriota bacterium]